jgi:hypothetical protein
MIITFLSQYAKKFLLTSFKYAVVTSSPMIVMTAITAYGRKYGYFIQIGPENVSGKWS